MSEGVFRVLFVALIVLATPFAEYTADKASWRLDQSRYNDQLQDYNETSLHDNLPVYAPVSPSDDMIGVIPEGDSRGYTSYQILYSSSTITVSLESLPEYCEASTKSNLQVYDNGVASGCNIVLTTKSGISVYGHRVLDSIAYKNLGPTRFWDERIKRIQPNTFFIPKDGVLITIKPNQVSSAQENGFTPQAVEVLADSLVPVTGAEREAFITAHIKPGQPVRPYDGSGLHSRTMLDKLPIIVLCALYGWALEKIFLKARRAYWFAYVPMLNFWVLCRIAARPGWWSLILLILGVIGGAIANAILIFRPLLYGVFLGLAVFWWVLSASLAESFGRSRLFAVLLFIPPQLGYLILGFGNSVHEASAKPGKDLIAAPTLSPSTPTSPATKQSPPQ